MIVPSVVISAVYAYRPTFTSVFLDATAVLALTFFATVVAAILLPWRRKDLYNASPIARYKVAGIPAITVVGVITGAFLLFMLYEWSFNGADLYGTTFSSTQNSVYYFLATYAAAIVIYVFARVERSRQGIDLSRIHHESPVEYLWNGRRAFARRLLGVDWETGFWSGGATFWAVEARYRLATGPPLGVRGAPSSRLSGVL